MATTIQVKDETLERLKHFKEHSKESYDEIINKVMNKIEESEFTEEFVEGIKWGIADIKAGKTQSIESIAKELGVRL